MSWKIKKFRTTGGIYGSTKELFTYDKLKGKQSVLRAWLFIDVEGFITKLYKDNSRMAQKLISRINQRAHYSKNEDRPTVSSAMEAFRRR